MIAFIRHLLSFLVIKCVIRQLLASQDPIVDMIFEWLEFLVEVQTEKIRKSTTEKNRKKKPKKTEGYRKFQIWDWYFFSAFFGLQPPLDSKMLAVVLPLLLLEALCSLVT